MKESKQIVTTMPTKSPAKVTTTKAKTTRSKSTTTRTKRTPRVTTTKRNVTRKVSTKKLKRPAKSVLTFNHYVRDYQSRVKIHNYEFTLFLNDCKSGLQSVDKSARSFYHYALQSYRNHFNV